MFFVIWTLPIFALYAIGLYMGLVVLSWHFLFVAVIVFLIHGRFVQVLLAMEGHGVDCPRKVLGMPLGLFIAIVILCVFTGLMSVTTVNTNLELFGYGMLSSTVTIILSWYLYVSGYTWYYREQTVRSRCIKHGLPGPLVDKTISKLRARGMFKPDSEEKQ